MPFLVVVTGANRGVVHPAGVEPVILGRDPAATVVLFDDEASRRHARVALKGAAYFLEDLDSKNRTYVNGLPQQRAELRDGDRIRIGRTEVLFVERDPSESPQDPAPGRRTRTARLSAGRGPGLPPVPIETGLLLGESSALRRAVDLLGRIAGSDATVLIQGETGTGKELAARAIHQNSRRRHGPYEVVNCAAIPEGFVESELFGYEKGAFTGAVTDKPGRFELAEGGTLFLDEVGELPLPAQAKLLRAMENREVQRLGSTKTRKIDVRFVGATNRDLSREAAEKRFREDLLFRLKVVEIRLPPLREREEDVLLLARHFLREASGGLGRTAPALAPEAEAALTAYPWPGNVRELRNVMERAAILCDGSSVTPGDLPVELAAATPGADGAAWSGGIQTLRAIEERHIRRILDLAGGNKAAAAKMLGIDRSTLYARLKEMERR